MTNKISIASPELLHINHGGTILYGADQEWYNDRHKRHAGCGPTACANLMWYFSKSRETCRNLCQAPGSTRQELLSLMEETWDYVTPGNMGVNSTSLFIDGALRFGKDHGVSMNVHVLDIPKTTSIRPDYMKVEQFLENAFCKDLPVAFLNLSNGRLKNLDNWHWVTLIGIEEKGIRMYDQGLSSLIDLKLWLETTMLGGGLIALDPVAAL